MGILKQLADIAKGVTTGGDGQQRSLPLYGYCPHCGAAGKYRERQPDGNDLCWKGHVYPSRNAK